MSTVWWPPCALRWAQHERGAKLQADDRGEKFSLYWQLASLHEYILVDPDTRRVESFRRSALGEWVVFDMSDDAAMQVASVACTVSMDLVFAGVEPAQEP